MASTNSTTKSSLNLSTKSDAKNLYTEDSTYVLTGNAKGKNFSNILNSTYTLAKSDSKEINAKLLSYDDGIVKKGSEVVGASGLEADKEYTIYGQPDKWIYDYSQKYNNCGVVSALNVLSMAGVKDIQQFTTDYEAYLKTGIVKTKTYTMNGEVKTITTTTYPKPLFKYETEELFTLWAVQNSKNDDMLYEKIYAEFAEKGGNTYEANNRWSNIYDSFCIHSNNYTDYPSVKNINEEDGGTYAFMQRNILNAYGVDSEIKVENIEKLYDLPTHQGRTSTNGSEEDHPHLEGLPPGALPTEGYEKIKSTQITDSTSNKVTVNKTITKYYKIKKFTHTEVQEMKDTSGNTLYEADGVTPKTETVTVEEDKRIYYHITTETITTTEDFNKYTTAVEETTVEEAMQGEIDAIATVEDIEKIQYDSSETKDTTITYKQNFEKYSFVNALEKAVREGKGIIIGGNARGLTGDEKGEYAGHAITLTGVVHGETLKETFNGKDRYEDDVVGFYVIDSGGWLTKTENAQFVDVNTLYNFLTDFAKKKDRTSTDTHFQTSYVSTKDCIRDWADNLNLVGTSKKNVLTGNSGNNKLYGGNGDDFLYGEKGNDYLYGQNHNDTLYGGSGNDYIDTGKGNDIVVIKSDDIIYSDSDRTPPTVHNQIDTIVAKYGKNSIQFEDIDINYLTFSQSNSDLTIDYTKTHSGANLASSIVIKNYFKNSSSSIKNIIDVKIDGENSYMNTYDFVRDFLEGTKIVCKTPTNSAAKLYGTKYADIIVGGNYNDTIKGYAHNDILYGATGNDTIYGGDGSDIIYGSYGNDKILGERGDNIIKYEQNFEINGKSYSGFGGNDYIYSGKGRDFIEMKSVASTDLKYTKSGNNLVIYYTDKGDSITIQNYFKLKGRTSVKNITLSDGTIDLVNKYEYIRQNLISSVNNKRYKGSITGGDGYDVLYASNWGDTIDGKNGNDTIYGGNGSDIITGGYGDDKMYGKGGNNTYYFNYVANGYDTISTSGSGRTTLVFDAPELNFNQFGLQGGTSNNSTLYDGSRVNFSYTKSKNDLIINYATSQENAASATVKIANFFKSKNSFILQDANGHSYDLKNQVYVYMKANETKATKISGSTYNDYIMGGSKNDTLYGGRGNDIIIGGKGNDKISGGYGQNTIIYNKDDGNDTIYLSKGERLNLKLQGFNLRYDGSGKPVCDDISFKISGKNLLIYYKNSSGSTSSITLKNYGKSDITGAGGSLNLYVNNVLYKNIKADNILPTYSNFTAKKYKYTGTWLGDTIDASRLSGVKKNKGASISSGAGNDVIIGSRYNDTIKASSGNDTIVGGYGTNKIDGGSGNDTYKIFYDKSNSSLTENSIIKDTGRTGSDTAIIYDTKDNVSVWFNITRYGRPTYTMNVTEYNEHNTECGKATLTGVENVVLNNNTDDTSDDLRYDYRNAALLQEVTAFLNSNNYKDVNYVMTKTYGEDKNTLLAIFNKDDYWTQA